ncbi:hypothetical protein ACFE04_008482 [Oxalis oulophora]
MESSNSVMIIDTTHIQGLDESYRPLPVVYLVFLSLWLLCAFSWTINTYKNRGGSQSNNLQWMLACVPLIKALQLTLSFLFWYSCIYLEVCSLWLSFGVYVSGVIFQTAYFVSFLLISHGYCITCERLSVSERRTTAALGSVLYLTFVGYKASVPYFTVLLPVNYLVSFYIIFHHISQNLTTLREQLSFIEVEDVQPMHDAVQTKYNMFKKFQGAMQIVALVETVIYLNVDESSANYWLRLLVREWAQLCIFLYIGWTFRSQDLAPRFSVMPTLKSKGESILPPIYSIEMDATMFKEFSNREWHIGLPTYPFSNNQAAKDSVLVIIQHPHSYRPSSASKISLTPSSNSEILGTTYRRRVVELEPSASLIVDR